MATKNKTLSFYFVDVFAVEPLSGNPLVVVDGGTDLTHSLLQRIAREFNQSETTFILPPTQPQADWRLRSFTSAGVEVGGAGHNALGAWWWLAESGRLSLTGNTTVFHQEIGDRILPVTITQIEGRLADVVMEQESPQTGKRLEDIASLAASLGLTAADLAVDRLSCQVVSTGAAHLMVPIRDREAVDRIVPDTKALFALLESVGGEGCYVFSLDPRLPDGIAYARFFNPTVGIWEDPATGTAAGPLAAYLVAHGLASSGQMIKIEQGTAMGRTSLIQVEVLANTVRILGRCVVVANGQLIL
jgi:trans-2,3-dihydro-3-hydroxyanthranilate isomerase